MELRLFIRSKRDHDESFGTSDTTNDGTWIDVADMSQDEIEKEIREYLQKRNSEDDLSHDEWVCTSVAGEGQIEKSLYVPFTDLDPVLAIMTLVDEYGDAALAYAETQDYSDWSEEHFKETYCGNAITKAEWGSEHAISLGDIKKEVRDYFDGSRYVRDLEDNGWKFAHVKKKVYAFRPY